MRKVVIPFVIALPLTTAAAGGAHAAEEAVILQTSLAPLNGSGASGSATVELADNRVTVDIDSHGLLAGAPHAQHFHIGGRNMCPTPAADQDGDGRVSTVEGLPSYGPIKVSLTTAGDTSQNSALAADRMPVADDDGDVNYSRTIEVSDNAAAQIRAGKAVIVQHGVDYNGNGKYDGEARSDVDRSLPAEATHPAVCGQLTPVPVNGLDAGGGGAASDNRAALLGLGGGMLVAAAGGVFAIRRARRGR